VASSSDRTNLAQTIQSAANTYESNKFEENTVEAAGLSAESTISTKEEVAKEGSRAKSIAEKLGFMNFDDDEFDTPSFMRKDGQAPESHS
jgi:cell division protein FtsZ